MVFPQWTEIKIAEEDAIQYLRLNELRDHLNDVLFPYLTTITPYFRLVSWLTWIYTNLYKKIQAESEITLNEYNGTALRVYSIFASSNILYVNSVQKLSWGPIGVTLLKPKLAMFEGDEIDFNEPTIARPLDPTPTYRTALINNMKIFEERNQPIARRQSFIILIPTDLAYELAACFENKWSKIINVDDLMNKKIFNKELLIKLGEAIFLQGLSYNDKESIILRKAVLNSLKHQNIYDNFIKIVYSINKNVKEINSSDVAIASLYRNVEKEETVSSIALEDSNTLGLLAFHELHTHFSYGADAILDALVELAKSRNPLAISKKFVLEQSSNSMNLGRISYSTPIREVKKLIESPFKKTSSSFIKKLPPLNGQLGFQTIERRLSETENKYDQINLGSIVIMQSACCQEVFDKKFLEQYLPYHRDVFSAYTTLEELQSLNEEATFKDWVSSMVELISDKHDEVANSKGPYSKRFRREGDNYYFYKEAGFGFQRGRLNNAVIWLSDIGLLKRYDGHFELIEGSYDKII